MKLLKIIAGAAIFVSLCYAFNTEDFAPFIACFLLAQLLALANKNVQSPLVALNVFPCSLAGIASDENCAARGGMSKGYWAKYSDIDWQAIKASTTNWDSANQSIKVFVMEGAATFKLLSHDKKQGFYESVYTATEGTYKNSIKTFFMGKNRSSRMTIQNAISCCELVYIVISNDGTKRIFGVEWDGEDFQKPLTPLSIARHADLGGQLGQSDKPRDELDLEGENLYPPMFLEMTEAAIPK